LKALQYSEEEDATLYDHLGDIYNALGQKDKAKQAWDKSLSLETSDVVRKKIEAAGK
jgi:predicted negative regulator of RcsB-dependent stress response